MRRRDAVLLIASNFPPVRGGSAVVYGAIARRAGGRVHVLAPRRSYVDNLALIGWREYDRGTSHPIDRLTLLRTRLNESGGRLPDRLGFVAQDAWLRLRLAWCVARILATRPIGAICVGELIHGAWLLRAMRFWPGVRRIAYVHGEEITTEDDYDPGGARRRRAIAAADRVITVSRFSAAAIENLAGGGQAAKLRLIGNGVDYPRFAETAPRRDDLVARYGLDGHFTFVSVCRLLEKKGVDHAIRAFAQLHATAPETRLLIVGTGPFALRLAEIARAEHVADAVIFAGDVPDDELAAHYRLGDVFVMPNRAMPNGDTEGFGLVFLEANAAGLPVIAGRDGGSGDAVTDGVNGLVVDGHSVEAIASAMRSLHADAALRMRLAAAGRVRSMAADWSVKAASFLAACLDNEVGAATEGVISEPVGAGRG